YKISRNIDNIVALAQNSTSMNKVLAAVRRKLVSNKKFTILTANPEIVLQALNNSKLASILINSDILISDGFGLSVCYDFLSKIRYQNKVFAAFAYLIQGFHSGLRLALSKKKNVVKGRKLFIELMKLGNRLGWKVYLLGGESDEAKEAKERLETSLKKIKIEFDEGPMINKNAIAVSKKDYEKEKTSIKKINSIKPDFLFVAFGAPKQELWIDKNLSDLNCKAVMPVGGTFNYISGKVSLPSEFFDKFGLEWLWRLIIEPKRIVRIFKAVIIFPLKIYFYKLRS
ncbi:WecB/TagA/CpsF family glycosyltransferase, partial [Patescibacteria group bacterium]